MRIYTSIADIQSAQDHLFPISLLPSLVDALTQAFGDDLQSTQSYWQEMGIRLFVYAPNEPPDINPLLTPEYTHPLSTDWTLYLYLTGDAGNGFYALIFTQNCS